MNSMAELLDISAARHRHLCPRQVLGVRMGLYAGQVLTLPTPQTNKRLYVIMETDGCALDGVAVATGCSVGRRTMRIEDCGKVAATFIDIWSGQTIRLVPRATAREMAAVYAPGARNRWTAQLVGYQCAPDDALFELQEIELLILLQEIIGRPGQKAVCESCGEEVINGRERHLKGMQLCRTCAGDSYYAFRHFNPVLRISQA